MSPHRDRGTGTYLVDLILGPLGRCKRASGTSDLAVYRDVVATLRRLRTDRRWDLLALVVNGRITPVELCDAIWNARLGELPTAEEAQLLKPMVERWVAGLDRGERTKRDYKSMLLGLTINHATLAALPRLLEARRRTALTSGHRSSFNHLYSAARVMLQAELGPDHAITKAVWRIAALRVDPRKGNPQTPEQVRALAGKLGRHSASLWALCLTGMRRGEYWGRRFTVQDDRIAIAGTKTKAARREAPKIYPVAAPTCSYRWFKKLIHEAGGGAVTVHDCRYTWMRWLEDAGVPAIRIRFYAGHAVKDVSELYRRGRGFTEHLVGDAQRVRDWLGDRGPTLALEIAR